MVTKGNLLVTGGSGKVGRATIALLQEHGYSVRNADQVPLDGVRTIKTDTCDLGQVFGAMHGMDAVIHLAAIPSPQSDPPEVVFRTNVLSTFNVLQAATTLSIKKVILASSLSALGLAYSFCPVALKYLPIDEAHPLLAQDSYGISKIVGEDTAEGFARRDPEMALVSLRFTFVVTPEESEPAFKVWLSNPQAGASVLWTYIDVRDAARSIVHALTYAQPGHQAFYINAPETPLPTPTLSLIQHYYPSVSFDAAKLVGSVAPIDCSAAREHLHFAPQYVWDTAKVE